MGYHHYSTYTVRDAIFILITFCQAEACLHAAAAAHLSCSTHTHTHTSLSESVIKHSAGIWASSQDLQRPSECHCAHARDRLRVKLALALAAQASLLAHIANNAARAASAAKCCSQESRQTPHSGGQVTTLPHWYMRALETPCCHYLRH